MDSSRGGSRLVMGQRRSPAEELHPALWMLLCRAAPTSQQQGHDEVGGYFDAAEVMGMGASLQLLDHLR